MELKSNSFDEDHKIPQKYTCDGENISPHLKWNKGPKETRSYALIIDDPDAPRGTWVHWVMFNIPVDVTELEENLPHERVLSNGANQGINDNKGFGYTGPCPPDGTHNYHFKIYALDKVFDPKANFTKDQLLKAMGEHILTTGEFNAKYTRK